jgi:hypothetical protein
LPVFILVTINDVQYLLKLNLTETEGWKNYIISLVQENGEPVAYLEPHYGTRAELQELKLEQEVIKYPKDTDRKPFWKDDVRTDDVMGTGDTMRNTNDEKFSTNYIWNGDWKNDKLNF